MNIDERLERLAERHEGPAQSVEMLVAENRGVSAEVSQLAEENRRRER
jgi:hypothetical protein